MATQLQLVLLIGLSMLGGGVSAYLGWADSGEPWDTRKFGASLLRSLIGAATSALTFQGTVTVDVFVCLSAFLIGAGVDVLGKRAQSVIQSKPASEAPAASSDNPPTP
jgi:hypothetical protein